MKSYIQGMITGGVLVFATLVFMGSSSNNDAGTYDLTVVGEEIYLLDTRRGDLYNPSYLDDKTWDKKLTIYSEY
jgi:hypothetical protein